MFCLGVPRASARKKEELAPADFQQLDTILTEKGCSYHDLFIHYIEKKSYPPTKNFRNQQYFRNP